MGRRERTYVGPGWWFDQEPRFFRLGFAWPTEDYPRPVPRPAISTAPWLHVVWSVGGECAACGRPIEPTTA